MAGRNGRRLRRWLPSAPRRCWPARSPGLGGPGGGPERRRSTRIRSSTTAGSRRSTRTTRRSRRSDPGRRDHRHRPDRRSRTSRSAAPRSIDLKGRRVLPGLIDGHLHGCARATTAGRRASGSTSSPRARTALAMYAAKADRAGGRPVDLDDGGGWNINQLDDPTPFTFDELTAARRRTRCGSPAAASTARA